MKKNVRQLICLLLLVALMTSAVLAASVTVSSFSDVPRSHWGYETIMDMTRQGLFEGTSAVVNGVGTFMPEKSMTRAEFVIVALRALYPDEAKTVTNAAGTWWKNWYTMALEKGLLYSYELNSGSLNTAMTRQEMAMVLVRCVAKQNEKAEKLVARSQIADFDSVSAYYKNYVRECFSLGLICGMDGIGTFAPTKSLTRAEAATVLARLVNKDLRIDVVFKQDEEEELIDGLEVELPWEESGAKQPENYTWAEYQALTEAQKSAFQDAFVTPEAYDKWLEKVGQKTPEVDAGEDQEDGKTSFETMPWEKSGAKQPENYTWAEYQALTAEQKDAFIAAFASPEAYDAWLVKNGQKKAEEDTAPGDGFETMPWEKSGAKQPENYTWAEYQALTAYQKTVFQASFATPDAYEAWMKTARGY